MKAISRRGFLLGSAAMLAAAALKPERLASAANFRIFGDAARETTPITLNDDFYITSYHSTPEVDVKNWSLRIKGLVRNPITLTYDDLLKRPRTAMISTLECIGNPIGGESIGNAKWEGVKLNVLLDEAGVDPKSVDLVLRGADGYEDSFPASRAMRDEVLLVTKMNGMPLPEDHGFPARVIVPGIYGMKNVKWLTELELVDHDFKGYWEKRGWSDDAEVQMMSRIDLPGHSETLQGRDYTIKGIAFSGTRGIKQVEVSTDGGTTWHPATLEPALSPFSWVRWSSRWKIPGPAHYKLVVRATDGQGILQSPIRRGEYPDGKSGLHEITVKVEA